MKIEKHITEQQGELVLSGELTLPYAAQLKTEILETMTEVQRLVVKFKDVTAADLSCLQLFCSAHRSAADQQKTFEPDHSDVPALQAVLAAAGMTQTGLGQRSFEKL